MQTKNNDIKQNFFYAIGRRKSATAQIRLYPKGQGKIAVNSKDYSEFFPYKLWQQNLVVALGLVGLAGKVDLEIKINGGGPAAGSEACRLGIARALVKMQADFKPLLRAAGYLTRDPRAKERKKPGLKRARRAPQWSKR